MVPFAWATNTQGDVSPALPSTVEVLDFFGGKVDTGMIDLIGDGVVCILFPA